MVDHKPLLNSIHCTTKTAQNKTQQTNKQQTKQAIKEVNNKHPTHTKKVTYKQTQHNIIKHQNKQINKQNKVKTYKKLTIKY